MLFIANTATFGFVVTLEAAVAQSRNAAAAHESFPKDQGRSLRRPLPSEQELVNDNSEGKQQEQYKKRVLRGSGSHWTVVSSYIVAQHEH